MTPAVANYPDYVRGDTIKTRQFTITQTISGVTSPVGLSGATIRVDFICRGNKVSKTEGNGITVTDAPNGVFQIDAFTLNVSGTWNYDVDIAFADGEVRTWVKGELKIVEDVTK